MLRDQKSVALEVDPEPGLVVGYPSANALAAAERMVTGRAQPCVRPTQVSLGLGKDWWC